MATDNLGQPAPWPTRLTRWLSANRRWPVATVLAVVLPKCAACVAASVGLAGALGIGGRELCGGTDGATSAGWPWLAGVIAGAVVALLGLRGRLLARTSLRVDGREPQLATEP